MKKLLSIILIFCPLLCLGQNHITVTPDIPLSQPISGHYTGWMQGKLWTWGGCNFPEIPCADGGKKHYYPQAYGASISIGQGVLILGGQDEMGSHTTVLYIIPQGKKRFHTYELAPLPIPLDNFAATYYDGIIYIAGGQSNGIPNRTVYAAKWTEYLQWQEVDTIPDLCRLQPCLQVQNNPTGPALYIFGGYDPG